MSKTNCTSVMECAVSAAISSTFFRARSSLSPDARNPFFHDWRIAHDDFRFYNRNFSVRVAIFVYENRLSAFLEQRTLRSVFPERFVSI